MRKKVLSVLLALCMVLSLLPVAALAVEYSDTDGHWAEAEIERWSEAGVVQGEGDGNFNPNKNMTRGEAAQVFVNLLKLKDKADLSVYTDVGEGAWYDNALSKVVAAGIMKGMSETTLLPKGSLSREMMFVMIARALGIAEEETANTIFADSEETQDWAVGYINALVNMGVITGIDSAHIAPRANINRASVMTALDRLIGGYGYKDGQTVEIVEGKITLVVADNVKLTGTANENVPIVIAGDAEKVDMSKVEGKAVVRVLTDPLEITGAPAGTEVITDENVSDVTVNGVDVSENDYIVPEEKPASKPSTGSGTAKPKPDPKPEPAAKYTVTFHYNYPNGEEKVTEPVEIEEKTKIGDNMPDDIAMNDEVKVGEDTYYFWGWYVVVDGVEYGVTADTIVYGNMEVQGDWSLTACSAGDNGDNGEEANLAIIKFVYNYPAGYEYEGPEYTKAAVTLTDGEGALGSYPTEFAGKFDFDTEIEVDGETLHFWGWNTQADGNGYGFSEKTVITENTTVYAIWGLTACESEPNGDTGEDAAEMVYVTFHFRYPDARGDVIYKAAVEAGKALGTAMPKLAVDTSVNGKFFWGWNTDKDWTADSEDDAPGFTGETEIYENMDVYAYWGTNSCYGGENDATGSDGSETQG